MDIVKAKLAQYLLINADIKELEAQKKAVKEELEPYLRQAPENARGSRVVAFSEPLEVDGIRYKSLQKVRKSSRTLNEERVLAFLKQKARDASPDGIPFEDSRWLSPVVIVEHVDQDALWDLFVNDKITQEELDSFWDVTESFAFMPTKE